MGASGHLQGQDGGVPWRRCPQDLTAQGWSRAKLAVKIVWALWWDPLLQVRAVLPGISWTGSPPGSAHPVQLPCLAMPRRNEDMTAPLACGVMLSLSSLSLPRTSVCPVKRIPTPVVAMRTRSEATGQAKATTCSPWWATPWAWATSGGFPTSPTRTAEVPVLRGRDGWAHRAVPEGEEGQLRGPALRLGTFGQSWT